MCVLCTHKAMMVVNGLTTVYCKTPSLHLNSNTLSKKNNSPFELLISYYQVFSKARKLKSV